MKTKNTLHNCNKSTDKIKQMAVVFAYINALLMCMLTFRHVIASVDSRSLLSQPKDKVVNNSTEINCTELEVSLKIHIEQQKFLLQKFDDWMTEHETNEYGESEFKQIRYAEETISTIQEEFNTSWINLKMIVILIFHQLIVFKRTLKAWFMSSML